MEKYSYRFTFALVISIILLTASCQVSSQLTINVSINQKNQMDDSFIRIPFDLIDDKMILDAEINEVKGKLCFEINREGLQIDQNYFTNKNTQKGAQALLENSECNSEVSYSIRIGDFFDSFQTAKSLDSEISSDFDMAVFAIIGRDLFSRAEIMIDYNTKMITVFPLHETTPMKSLILIG